MKRNNHDSTTTFTKDEPGSRKTGNAKWHSVLVAEPSSGDLSVILAGLQTMRDGDFSVRLPGDWTGLAGKVADTFNSIVAANQQMSQELKRVGARHC